MLASPDPAVLAGIIQAAATAAAAWIGFWALGRQVRLSGEAARIATRETEVWKLKLDIYRGILRSLEAAEDANAAETAEVHRLIVDLKALAIPQGQLGPTQPPDIGKLIALHGNAERKAIAIVTTIEQWLIIDLRLRVFVTAANVIAFNVRQAWAPILPHHLVEPADIHGDVYWPMPTPLPLERLAEALGDRDALHDDFRREMQNLLLGGLFDARVPQRQPIAPDSMVVSLDRATEIEERLLRETDWGETTERLETEQRQRFGVPEPAPESSTGPPWWRRRRP